MTTPVAIISDALTVYKDFTGDSDAQVQTIQMFISIATSKTPPSMDTLGRIANIGQSSVSRNIKALALGKIGKPGHKLISVDLDPYDNRHRVVKLTPKGQQLIDKMEAAIYPKLVAYFSKVGLKKND